MNDKEAVTFEDLRVHLHMGRAYFIRKDGRRKVYGYKSTIKTKIGIFEISDWQQAVYRLIEQSGETDLYKQLYIWEQEHNFSRRTKEELQQHVLELHVMRIFDNREWVSFIPFNQRFRPEELKKVTLIWVTTTCCQKPGLVIKEQLDKAERRNHQIFCPHCGRCSDYHVCN